MSEGWGSPERPFDLLVVGGGINGAGIARDAAGRNLSVCLVEMDDLGSGTSSRSTKLIHGGLRYLEHYEFRLVREALIEREILLRNAPHLIAPLRFVLPHHRELRPAWLLRLGLFLYDHLGGRELLPGTRSLDLAADAAGLPLKPGMFARGFEYSDCTVDDARLVVLNARDAADRGASIRTRTKVVAANRSTEGWSLTLEDGPTGRTGQVAGRVLVNAAGPWVADMRKVALGAGARAPVRLVQGSHIVVPRLFEHERAYIFQNGDGRIVFAIPYEGAFTLIGTTDKDYVGDPAAVEAGADEIGYLCDSVNRYFRKPVEPADVVWHYSGIRPLYDDGASEAKAATRDYVLELDDGNGEAPLLSVFGGKITTYRRLAEEALSRLAPHLSIGPGWTATAPLPGGDFPPGGRAEIVRSLRADHPFLTQAEAERFVGRYGTRAALVLGPAGHRDDSGPMFGPDLCAAEISYLVEQEWAASAADILWRRTKAGLRMSGPDLSRLRDHLSAALAARGSSAGFDRGHGSVRR
jgi:glycerol-3-phosphate dehydrogenase